MNTINGEHKIELIINKSTFITYLKNVTTVEDAKDYITYIKLLHPDATHHVTAYTVGKTGEYGHSSDDGEPSGTAGLPVLDVFRKNDITNFVCIVVRYFGGIKLGAGGLIRAYSKSASSALASTSIVPIVEYTTFKATFDYSLYDLLENRLKNYDILEKSFSNQVTITVKVPKDELLLVTSTLSSITNGLIKIKNDTFFQRFDIDLIAQKMLYFFCI